MGQYELRPFAGTEADWVATWATSSEDRRNLTSDDEHISGQTIALWRMEAAWAFTLRDQGDLVAYGELIEDDVEGDLEVLHLLVAPDRRRQGVGKALLSRLCVFAGDARPYPDIWLRAPRGSIAMIQCARGVGFTGIPEVSGPRYLWMKKRLRTNSEKPNDP